MGKRNAPAEDTPRISSKQTPARQRRCLLTITALPVTVKSPVCVLRFAYLRQRTADNKQRKGGEGRGEGNSTSLKRLWYPSTGLCPFLCFPFALVRCLRTLGTTTYTPSPLSVFVYRVTDWLSNRSYSECGSSRHSVPDTQRPKIISNSIGKKKTHQ